MYSNQRFALIILSFILLSCSSTKKTKSAEANSEIYFIIGSGGGFTGLYNQYKIYDSGLIEFYDFENKSYQEYYTVSKSQVKGFFNQIKDLNLAAVDYNKPGNVSDYIEVLTTNPTRNRIVWAYGNSLNPEIIKLFESVMQLIREEKN